MYHPAVDLHSGQMDAWTTGLDSEKRTTANTGEVGERELVLVFVVL